MKTAELPIPKKEHYTHADYVQLPEGVPYELIDGQLIISPAPSVQHQRIIRKLLQRLSSFVEEHDLGEVFVSPIDVYLSETDTLQPDLVYVSKGRLGIVGEQEIEGSPDLVVEVLSPSTAYYDLKKKKRLYEHTGVREYWIIDLETEEVEIYENTDDGFIQHARVVESGTATSTLLDGFSVDLAHIF